MSFIESTRKDNIGNAPNMNIIGFCHITIFGQKIEIGTPAESQEANKINMKIEEAIDAINKVNEQLVKAKGEILGELARLVDAKGELTPEQSEIVESLRNRVKEIDDIIPDVVEPPTPPEEENPPTPTEEDGGNSGEG